MQEIMGFITGAVDPSVTDLLLHELGLAKPVGQDGPERLGLPADFEVAVIGAGMSGLVASWHLSRLGIAHTVFERQSDIGGVWVVRAAGWSWGWGWVYWRARTGNTVKIIIYKINNSLSWYWTKT
jgi:hypothetical protein